VAERAVRCRADESIPVRQVPIERHDLETPGLVHGSVVTCRCGHAGAAD
jgi:hypothetical protein